MSVYRFPAMSGLDNLTLEEQLDHIDNEVYEAYGAYAYCQYGLGSNNKKKDRESFGMELLDIIHATETALRMEFSDEEVEELRAKVIKKNADRGYYKC